MMNSYWWKEDNRRNSIYSILYSHLIIEYRFNLRRDLLIKLFHYSLSLWVEKINEFSFPCFVCWWRYLMRRWMCKEEEVDHMSFVILTLRLTVYLSDHRWMMMMKCVNLTILNTHSLYLWVLSLSQYHQTFSQWQLSRCGGEDDAYGYVP